MITCQIDGSAIIYVRYCIVHAGPYKIEMQLFGVSFIIVFAIVQNVS